MSSLILPGHPPSSDGIFPETPPLIRASLISGVFPRGPNGEAWFLGKPAQKPVIDHETFFLQSIRLPVAPSGGLFAVFRGIGPPHLRGLAAETAARQMSDLRSMLDQEWELEPAIQIWSMEANRRIRLEVPTAGVSMALVYFTAQSATTVYVGDSRVYRMRGKSLELLTRDHTYGELLRQWGLISPAEAITHPLRRRLTRYYGMQSALIGSAVEIGAPSPLRLSDRYILCTGSLTDSLSLDALSQAAAGAISTQSCAVRLYARARLENSHLASTIIVSEIVSPEANT